MAPKRSGWTLRADRPDLLVVFGLTVVIGLVVAGWPMSPSMRAELVLERLGFEYTAREGDPLPAPATSAPTVAGFGRIDLFSSAVRVDGGPVESQPVQLTAARSEARVRFPASRIDWGAIAGGSTITLETSRVSGAVELTVSVSGGASRLQVTTAGPLELVCEHCVLTTPGQPPRRLGARTKLSIEADAGTRVEIAGGDADVMTVSLPAPEPFEWKGFSGKAFDFHDGRPLGARSSVAGQGTVTVSGLGEEKPMAIARSQEFSFKEIEPITVNSLTLTSDGHLAVSLDARVRSFTIGGSEQRYSMINVVKDSRRWSSIGVALLFGLTVLNFFEGLKIRVSRAGAGKKES